MFSIRIALAAFLPFALIAMEEAPQPRLPRLTRKIVKGLEFIASYNPDPATDERLCEALTSPHSNAYLSNIVDAIGLPVLQSAFSGREIFEYEHTIEFLSPIFDLDLWFRLFRTTIRGRCNCEVSDLEKLLQGSKLQDPDRLFSMCHYLATASNKPYMVSYFEKLTNKRMEIQDNTLIQQKSHAEVVEILASPMKDRGLSNTEIAAYCGSPQYLEYLLENGIHPREGMFNCLLLECVNPRKTMGLSDKLLPHIKQLRKNILTLLCCIRSFSTTAGYREIYRQRNQLLKPHIKQCLYLLPIPKEKLKQNFWRLK